MPDRYWLVHPNGGRQLIDPRQFDLTHLVEQARRIGGRLIVESIALGGQGQGLSEPVGRLFEPPLSALGPLFRTRLGRIHDCETDFIVDINSRPTHRVLGGYYKSRRLVRVYSHDRELGRRPMEELFDTFLHEVAHHLEYTEPGTFQGLACGRVPGRMHSPLFWRILGELKGRWADSQRNS
ncbi:hypothetical protein P12x_001484 [Tundrisphaera lichenicola]|uniref:hypothetical protein n=1 Tax=Tundrisphaera lichenicola TaxID=2029860 RepID=UPI003EBCE38E